MTQTNPENSGSTNSGGLVEIVSSVEILGEDGVAVLDVQLSLVPQPAERPGDRYAGGARHRRDLFVGEMRQNLPAAFVIDGEHLAQPVEQFEYALFRIIG